MHRYCRALAPVVLTCAVLAAACTSKTDTGSGSSGGGGGGGSATTAAASNATGVTNSTIRVSLIAADLSLLTKQHLAPEIGDAKKTLEAVVAHINANGGVAGRKIELVPHVVSGTDVQLNPDIGRQICVQATEDDKPFAVIIAAAVTAPAVQCTAIDHKVLTISMDSWPASYYQRAGGRLFSLGSHISISSDREYGAWPKILADAGYLKGKRIGIIRQDAAEQQESVDDALVPELKRLGMRVAAESVLPCPEGSPTCEQHDVAVQRMKDAHVNFVFLVAQNLAGADTVQAAQKLDFKPQWATIGNNVTNTVARFYAPAKDDLNGAIGVDTGFHSFTPAAADCNRTAASGGAEKFAVGSDGYGFTAVTCIQMESLAKAIDAVHGPITQAAVIKELENQRPVMMLTNPTGSLSAAKHYAATAVFLSRYSAATQQFEPIDNRKPIPTNG